MIHRLLEARGQGRRAQSFSPAVGRFLHGARRGAPGRLAIALGAVLLACAAGACTTRDESGYKQAAQLTGGDPRRGIERIGYYGCGACHTIPGIQGANATVGPPLTGIAARTYLGGHLQNTPANMMRWIQHPQEVSPGTAMPPMGVTDQDARDITAYLYTLR